MKLFIALKERYKLQKALRVKVVFNRVNFECLKILQPPHQKLNGPPLTVRMFAKSIDQISCDSNSMATNNNTDDFLYFLYIDVLFYMH